MKPSPQLNDPPKMHSSQTTTGYHFVEMKHSGLYFKNMTQQLLRGL